MEEEDFLSTKNQRRFIKKILSDSKFAHETFQHLDYNDFDEEFQLLMKNYMLCHKTVTTTPSKGELDMFIESRDEISAEIKTSTEELLSVIFKEDISDIQSHDLWITSFTNFIKKSRLIKFLYDGADYIDPSVDNKKTYPDLSREMGKIASISFTKSKAHDYVEDFEERFEHYQNFQQQRIEAAIPLFNQLGFGDFGTLSLFLGETNIGKCWQGDTVISVYVEYEDWKILEDSGVLKV